jgi:ABC-2 type transport system ATP-binding protein
MTALLHVNQLTKTYTSTQAVRGISFAIEPGHCVALLGPNGSGKTTTLKMLAGLIRPTSGTITFDGIKHKDIRPYLGYLPQNPGFHEWMTGYEFLMYIGQLAGLTKSEAKERTVATLQRLGLESAAKRLIRGYSGGMRQRLGICQALIHKPKLLLLDEPVSALDPVGRREILELLSDIRTETTVLYSTHVLHDAEAVSDNVIMLVAGNVVMAGPIKEIRQKNQHPKVEIAAATALEPYHSMLSALPGVEGLDGIGWRVTLVVRDIAQVRASVMRLLVEEQIPVDSVEFGLSTLEDLFMEAVRS